MISSADKVADLLESQGKKYSVDAFYRLIYHAQDFLSWSAFHKNAYSKGQLIELLRTYKELATGDSSSTFRAEDWRPLFLGAASLFSIYSNYHAMIQYGEFRHGPSFLIIKETMEESLRLLKQWVTYAPDQKISFEMLDRVIQTLENSSWLPANVTKNSLSPILRHFINKTLRSNLQVKDKVEGLGLREVDSLKAEFERWLTIQSIADTAVSNRLKLDHRNILEHTDTQIIQIAKIDLSQSLFNQMTHNLVPFLDTMNHIKSLRPMFKVNDNRLNILPLDELGASGVFQNVNNFSFMNTISSVVRILIKSFASDINIASMSGVTEGDMRTFYKLMKPLGVELRIMDPRKVEGGTDYFTEANLFTFSGLGISPLPLDENDLLLFKEAMEFVSLLWTSNHVRFQVYKKLLSECRRQGYRDGPPDFSGDIKVSRECFINYLNTSDLREISHLPYMHRHIMALTTNERTSLVRNLSDLAKIDCEDHSFIEGAEIVTMTTVLHYTEVIFNIYDVNNDGILNSREIMSAFQRFRGYLDRLLFLSLKERYSLSWIKAIFSSLVKNQKIPTTTTEKSQVYYFKLKYFNNDENQNYSSLPTMTLNRSGFVKVLSNLAVFAKSHKEKWCKTQDVNPEPVTSYFAP